MTVYRSAFFFFFFVLCPKTTHCKYVLIYFIALFKESKRKKRKLQYPFFLGFVCVLIQSSDCFVEGAVLCFSILDYFAQTSKICVVLQRFQCAFKPSVIDNTHFTKTTERRMNQKVTKKEEKKNI